MAVVAFVVAFLAVGSAVAFVAFSGGPTRAREAYLTGGRRGFRIVIPILYVGLGIAVPAVVLAARQGGQGEQGALATKHGNKEFTDGKVLFRQTCWSCHTLKAAGSQGVTGTNLDERVSASLSSSARASCATRSTSAAPATGACRRSC